MVDVLSNIVIPEPPHSCQGFMDDANRGSLIGDVSGTSSQPLHLQDDVMVDILTDISVPLPPAILDNDAHYFEGQDDAMADTLIGIEIPSPPRPSEYHRSPHHGMQESHGADIDDASGPSSRVDSNMEMSTDPGSSSIGTASEAPTYLMNMLNKDTWACEMEKLERHLEFSKSFIVRLHQQTGGLVSRYSRYSRHYRDSSSPSSPALQSFQTSQRFQLFQLSSSTTLI